MDRLMIYANTAPYLAELLRGLGYAGSIDVCTTAAEARRDAPRAEILLSSRLPGEIYPLLTRCRWIQSLNAGVEDLMAAPVPPGVRVTRVVGLFGGYIAEYALGYMLAHTLGMRRSADQQGRREWQHFYIGRLEGRRLGVAGLGSIGLEVARQAAAMGMRVRGLSRGGAQRPGVDERFTPDRLVEFCTGLDFLALTLPLTPATEGLFGAEALAALAPGAVLINCGRGRVLQEQALLSALRSGRLGGAVLDVFAQEPLPPDHPYWTEPGVTVTPHISGPTKVEEVVGYFLANYRRLCAGEVLVGELDLTRGY